MIKNKKISVLIEVTAFIPNKTYGGQTTIDYFVKSLNESKVIDPTYIINEKSYIYLSKLIMNGKIISTKLPNNNFIKNLTLKKRILNKVNIREYDFILFFYNIGFRTEIPSFVFVHDLASRFYLKNMILKGFIRNIVQYQFVKRSITKCDYVICSTKTIKKEIVNLKLKDRGLISQIYFGNEKNVKQIQSNKKIHDYKNFIFFPSYKEPHKNINIVLEGFKKLLLQNKNNSDFKNIKFVFSGQNDSTSKHLRKKFSKTNIKNQIIFTGYISLEEMAFYYKHARIVIFPTLYEGFGLPVIECQNVNNRILLSNLPVLQEISNSEGIFFENKNVVDFVEKLNTALVSEHVEINYSNSLLNRSWGDFIKDYENLFISVLGKN